MIGLREFRKRYFNQFRALRGVDSKQLSLATIPTKISQVGYREMTIADINHSTVLH